MLVKKFIASNLVKGIGDSYAENVVNKFGEDSIDVLINQPEKLLDIDGIGTKKIRGHKGKLSR